MNDNRPPLKVRLTRLATAAGRHVAAALVCVFFAAVCLIAAPLLAAALVAVGFGLMVSPRLLQRVANRATKKAGAEVENWRRHLHVTDDAPFEVVRAAYKALAFAHHPDRNPMHPGHMARINAAWAMAQREHEAAARGLAGQSKEIKR